MKNIIANFERQTLTITKAFSKKASVYGTPAYKELAEAKRDNPDFKIIVKANNKSVSSANKVTISMMENYIAKHDETGEIMAKFNSLRHEELGENLHKTTFFQIKKWFFETYPDLKSVA